MRKQRVVFGAGGLKGWFEGVMQSSPQTPYGQQPMMPQRDVEGATASLVLGIIVIVFNLPIVGLILALVGLSKAKKAKEKIRRNPGMYSNGGIAEAGYVLCIIAIIWGSLSTLGCCAYVGFVGLAVGLAGAGAAAGH